MAMNMDAILRLKARVDGANAIQAFNRNLKGLEGTAKLSNVELGRMNIAINRMAREAGNTTAGLRQHVSALQALRDRTEIGSKAYVRLGKEIDQLKGKLKGLDGQAAATGMTLKDRLIGGLATIGVGRLTAGIVKTAGDFDRLVRTAAAIEGTGAYNELRESIERVASAAAGTPTEVAALSVSLSRAGFTAKETSQALQGIVQGAEATSVSFEEMGSIASDTMRAFGIETSRTQEVVDALVKTANSSNQSIIDVGQAMSYAAPVARSLGVSMQDLSVVIGLLADNGIRGSRAGTTLSVGLSRLQQAAGGADSEVSALTKGNARLAKAMAVLGSEVLDAQGKLKPIDQVLISLKRSFDQLSTTDRSLLAKALFGEEAGRGFLALLASSEQKITSLSAKIRDSSGAAAQARQAMQGFGLEVDVLRGNVEVVSNAIGDKFIVLLQPLARLLNAAISAAAALPKPLRDVAAAAAAAGIAVGGLTLAIKTLGGISAATAALKAFAVGATGAGTAAAGAGVATTVAAGGIKAMAAALLLNPWTAAIAGAAALTVAAYRLNEPFREFVDTYPAKFKTFWGEIGKDIVALAGRVQNVAQSILKTANDLLQGIVGIARSAVNGITQAAGPLTPLAQGIADFWRNTFAAAFSFIESRWQQTVANMINYSNPLAAALKGLGVDVGGAFVTAVNARTGAQRLQAAGVGATYTVGGITYDTATGRPVSGISRPAAAPVVPIPTVPQLSAAAAGGGGGGGGGRGRSGADGAAAAAKKAADDAARRLQEYNRLADTSTDLSRSLAQALEDVGLSMAGIGASAADQIRLTQLKAETDAQREYEANERRIQELVAQRNTLAEQGISVTELDIKIKKAAADAETLLAAKRQEASDTYVQSLNDLLPKADDYNRQLKEAALLAENKKAGIEGLSEVQKLNLQIELLGLEVLAKTNPALAEQIRLLREKAGALDAANKAQNKTFGESFKERIKDYTNSVKDLGAAFGEIAVNAIQGLEDKLFDFITTGKLAFREFVADVLKQISRLLLRLAIVKTIKAIFPGAGFAKGGAFAANGIQAFARGGVVSSPTLFPFAKGGKMATGLMAESGPEAIMPLKRTSDGRLGVEAIGGNDGGNVVVNVAVDAKGTKVEGSPTQGAALGRVIAAAVQQELIRQKRPGGLLTEMA